MDDQNEGDLRTTNPYHVEPVHMELFYNLLTEEMTIERSGQTSSDIPTAIFIKHGLKIPYLMHELLAISALHMGIRTTSIEARRSYHTYSTGLQNRALELFHETHPGLQVTADNAAQMFLFSSLVGIHLLADTLYQQVNLSQTIEDFTRSLDVSRGVHSVIQQFQGLRSDPELAPGFTLSQVIQTNEGPSLQECKDLTDRISVADMPSSTRQICQIVTAFLQQAYDAANNGSRVTAIFAWLVRVPAAFVELLRQHQPEAMIILAYYGALLHRGRQFWLINEGGRFLVESIAQSLDASWQDWMVTPLAAVR